MKNYFFLIIILISPNLFGQTYKPLLTPTKCFDDYIWSGVMTCRSTRHVVGADTTIGIYTYKKIINYDFLSGLPISLCSSPVINDSAYFSGICLREDTILRKVFIIHNDSQEDLFYDFSLLKGDTLKSIEVTSFCGEAIVDSIDYVIITNGDTRKRFFLNSGVYYIEGIGGLTGLYEPLGNCGIGFGSGMLCVKENDVNLFGNNCNNFFVSTKTYTSDNSLYSKVWKSDNQLYINSNQATELLIINSIGQILLKANFIKDMTIDLGKLPVGLLEILLIDKQNGKLAYKTKIINGI